MMPGREEPVLLREWVTLRDPDDPRLQYTFDVSFLLSGYHCIYGAGCPGIIEGRPDLGCCVHGAYLDERDDADELQRLAVEELDATTMQHHGIALERGVIDEDDDGEFHTRVVDGACVFLNRGDHPGGAGCALHQLAVANGQHHMVHKPTVCWQVPLHRTIEERTANDGGVFEEHTIAAYERGHWGDGGAAFAWYCTEDDDAMGGRVPLYRSMERELRTMVGDAVYDGLAAHLDRRNKQRNRVRFLPTV
jgi:hypothetical protein